MSNIVCKVLKESNTRRNNNICNVFMDSSREIGENTLNQNLFLLRSWGKIFLKIYKLELLF